MTLEPTYTLEEVAEAVGMSTRWVRDRCKDGAEHLRFGRKIKFTEDQYKQLRREHTKQVAAEAITTGRKKRAS